MSPKNSLLAAGLAALGLIGLAPPEPADPSAPAPPGAGAPAAPSPPYTVLLMSDGRLQQGAVSEDATRYTLHTRGGDIPIPKRSVEAKFRSVEEAYQYKVGNLPDRDLDERMKLARWCLHNELKAHAKEQLQLIVSRSPSFSEARWMLESLQKEEARAAIARVDSGVAKAGAEVVEPPAGASDRPDRIDPSLLRAARRELGINNIPQIGDLPPAMAVRRAGEFAHLVQPVLQSRCARCHNEQHPGSFQLVVIKPRRDRVDDALRANLDATLRLIDLENPDKSEILSSALVPHPNKQPVFKGANDPEYQILATWVKSLRAPKGSREVATSRLEGRPAAAGDERFATDRPATAPLPFTPTPPSADARPQPPQAINPVTPQPPGQIIPGSATGLQPYAPPDTDFPVPYMAGGPRPKLDSTSNPQPGPSPTSPNGPPPGAVPSTDAIPPPKRPPQPVKIDPALLERALMNRNAR
jgi:hypothetical protein